MTGREPVDSSARHRVERDLASTLFVEAGAGAGKTTALARRIVALVADGIEIGSIAAITFTEKAAEELRHRTRRVLELAADDDGRDDTGRHRCRVALDHLDAAPIGTLHAFATRLLREFPIEAELPPNFTVLDEVGSDIAFEERWTGLMLGLADDPDGARLLQFVRVAKIGFDAMRRIARSFGDSWDLVARRVDTDIGSPEPTTNAAVVSIIDALAGITPPEGDRSAAWLAAARLYADGLRRPLGEFALFELRELGASTRAGNKTNWRLHPDGERGLTDFRERAEEARRVAAEALRELFDRWQAALGAAIARFTLEGARQRAASGQLEFHDLLVLARRLIIGHPHVRRELHDRYRRLLIDEFQDTDPIQLDLAVRIAADPDAPQHDRWEQLVPLPGRLFFVGDPKQSVYRFRRADIGQYLRAADSLDAHQVALTTNFRSATAVVGWVNHTFGALITHQPGSQPEYRPLDPFRLEPGSVSALGETEHADSPPADELRRRESADVAETVVRAITQQWPVADADGGVRPCRLSDIAILLPSRLSLSSLQEALRRAGVPAQAENSSVVYATAEIRQLLLALRALDDPTNALALVSVLRSPLFGCSDRDLYRWYAAGGRWRADIEAWSDLAGPGIDDNPVRTALIELHRLSRQRHWSTPSELLVRLVTDRRVLELALADPGVRDTWRRVRFVIDQARAWSEAGGVGLRNYLAWTARQGEDGRYVAEAILPETDLDAVRIMTIHAAKGLEFPITILAGMTTRRRNPHAHAVVWTDDGWTLRSGSDYETFQPVDEQLDEHERLRLLYVACTRARDHLVVSLHRSAATKSSAAAVLAAVADDAPWHAPNEVGGAARVVKVVEGELPWGDVEVWRGERRRAIATAGRPSTLSPSRLVAAFGSAFSFEGEPIEHSHGTASSTGDRTLTPPGTAPGDSATSTPGIVGASGASPDAGLAKDPVDLELPAWQRGRYGTSVGRAVHAVLQSVDLITAADLDALATVQSAAEGIPDRVALIAALARSALGTPIVRTAAAGADHWRELFVAAPIGPTLIEGYIDLLVRTPSGLVVADYKTDHVADDGALADRVVHYRTQLAAYALVVEALLDEPVVEARLVFCRAGGATESTVPAWREAMTALRQRLESGRAPTMSDGDEHGHAPEPPA